MATQSETDDVPDYHPLGLSHDRLVQETGDKDSSITDDQWRRFREALIADKGEGALAQWHRDLYEDQVRELREDKDPDELEETSDETPECVEELAGSGETATNDSVFPNWGFVVYRTAGYDNPDRWVRAKAVWDDAIEDAFAPYVRGGVPGAREAQRKFRCHWVEGPMYNGMSPERLATDHWKRRENLPIEMRHSIAFCVDEASLDSMLSDKVYNFVLAVSLSCSKRDEANKDTDKKEGEDKDGAEDEDADSVSDYPGWTGYFKVSLYSMVNGVWPLINSSTLDPLEIGLGTGEDQMWCSVLRSVDINV